MKPFLACGHFVGLNWGRTLWLIKGVFLGFGRVICYLKAFFFLITLNNARSNMIVLEKVCGKKSCTFVLV